MGGSNVPKTQKACQVRLMSKWCWRFFHAKGVVHHEYLSQGSTLNQIYYATLKYRNVWVAPSDARDQNCAEVISGFSITTTLHWALRTREFLTKHSIAVLPHPYSSDLAPRDFFCSQHFKKPSKEEDLRRFRGLRQMSPMSWKPSQKKRTRTVSRSGNTHRWDKCVRWGGEYFEWGPDMQLPNKVLFMSSVRVFFERTSYGEFRERSWVGFRGRCSRYVTNSNPNLPTYRDYKYRVTATRARYRFRLNIWHNTRPSWPVICSIHPPLETDYYANFRAAPNRSLRLIQTEMTRWHLDGHAQWSRRLLRVSPGAVPRTKASGGAHRNKGRSCFLFRTAAPRVFFPT